MALREIGASIVLDGEKEFNSQMAAVNSELKNLGSEMSVVTAEFGQNATSVEALTKKGEILAQQQEQQQAKVDALQKAYDELSASEETDTKTLDRYQQDLNKAKAALINTTKAVEQNTKALEEAEDAAKKAEKPLAKLKTGWKNLAEKVKDFVKEHKAASAALKAGELTWKATAKSMELTGKAAVAITKYTGVAVGALATLGVAGVTALAGFAKEAAEAEAEAKAAAEAAGEAYQPGQYAKLAENLDLLTKGSQAAKAALGSVLLPALESLSGKGAALLTDFSAAMEAAGSDTGAQSAVIAEYVTKAVDMAREELPELMKLGGEIIGGLGEGLAENADEIIDAGVEILEDLIDGAEKALPKVATVGLDVVTKLLTSLLNESPDLLSAGLTMLSEVISGIGKKMPELVPTAIDIVGQLLTTLVEHAPDLLESGLELVLGIVEGLIEGIPDLIDAIPEMISRFAQAWKDKKDDLKEIGSQIVDSIVSGLKDAGQKIKDWFSGTLSGLRANISVSGEGANSTVSATAAATGLPYVPYDNYPAILHRGEQVLTAAEAAAYRSGAAGSSRTEVTVNVYPQTLDESETQRLVQLVNEELGAVT